MRSIWIFAFLGVAFGKFIEEFTDSSQPEVTTNQEKSLQEITIKLKVYYDPSLTKQLRQKRSFQQLEHLTKSLLLDVEDLYKELTQKFKVSLRLLDTKFLESDRIIADTEDGSTYLRNFCQSEYKEKQLRNELYLSVLFTGLDLYAVNINGTKIMESAVRSYKHSICNKRKSCTILEWRPDIMAQLMAHEIGHSIGLKHDEAWSDIKCEPGIMTSKYADERHPMKKWTLCNQLDFDQSLMKADKTTYCLFENPKEIQDAI